MKKVARMFQESVNGQENSLKKKVARKFQESVHEQENSLKKSRQKVPVIVPRAKELRNLLACNEKGLWSGGAFETPLPERPPI